jgi:amino-acid N-acetyltransferase
MLPRALSELYENIRDFWVARADDNAVIGCCALHVSWENLAEIRSLAVQNNAKGNGIGDALIKACLNDARELGILRVFALTYIPLYFEKKGFHHLEKDELPHKVWGDCIKCPKFPDCDEVAVSYELPDNTHNRS